MNAPCVGISLIAVVSFLLAANLAGAGLDKEEQIHTGIVITATADTLAMSDADGKNEHAHKVGAGAAITLDGKAAKLPELAKGDKVKVAVGQDGKVTRIEATRVAKAKE